MSKHRLLDGEDRVDIEVVEGSEPGHFDVRLDDEAPPVSVRLGPGGEFSVLVDGHSYEAVCRWDESKLVVDIGGRRVAFETDASRQAGSSDGPSSGEARVRAPMPGKVVKILVEAGDDVERGQGILLFEAMKMQNEVRSPIAGSLQAFSVEEGQAVESKEELFVVRSQ